MLTSPRASLALLFLLASAAWPARAGEPSFGVPPEAPLVVAVNDASTWVSIAKVYLSIGSLYLDAKENALLGRYEIDVPVKRSKSEGGNIRIAFETSCEEVFSKGGTLVGRGTSDLPNQPLRSIVCKVQPATEENGRLVGKIALKVTMGKRTLDFESTYTILRKPDGEGA